MNKRQLQLATRDELEVKRVKLDNIVSINKVIIRNDDDPHVYANIDCEYVTIGSYIYKLKKHNEVWNYKIKGAKFNNSVSLTLTQYDDLKDYIFNNKLVLNKYYHHSTPIINNLTISLTTDYNFKIITKIGEITRDIINILNNHIVSRQQNISTYYQGIKLNIYINEIDEITIGKVSSKTKIDIIHFDSNIVIYSKCIILDSKSVKIYITNCIDLNSSSNKNNINASKLPLLIDQKTLSNYAHDVFNDTFTDNASMIYTKNGIEYTFNIKVIDLNKQTKYKNTYIFSKDKSDILFESKTDNVIITDGKKVAEKICFSITEESNNKYNADDYIINVDNLTNYINTKINTLTNKQIFKYPVNGKQLRLNVIYINPNNSNNVMYEIDTSKTKIIFDTETKSKFIYVNNNIPYDIEKIIYKIKKSSRGIIFDLMFENPKTQIFDTKKLEKNIKNFFPKKTAVKHQMKLSYNGNNIVVAVKQLIFTDKTKNVLDKNRYSMYGIIKPETEFKFEISKNNKLFALNDTTSSDVLKNPILELEKYVGGITDELKTVVRTICLARGKLKDEFKARGLKAPKGIVLHGHPGTGKTTLARNLGKLLGCEGDRFRLMSGPEIFNKYVGESESNVRQIFKPAKDAWKKHGDKAPIYMVVIDEIDAMIPARNGSSGNPVRDSVVNQFLAEMDGLEQFDNLICIGITNRLELLDPAAVRAGRFGVHVKIDLPDKKARIKIFEIHTQKLRDINKLININFEKLSDLTDKFSGADIENIVGIASMLSLERLNILDDQNKELIDKEGLITQADFIKAIKEIKQTNKLGENTNLSHIYL